MYSVDEVIFRTPTALLRIVFEYAEDGEMIEHILCVLDYCYNFVLPRVAFRLQGVPGIRFIATHDAALHVLRPQEQQCCEKEIKGLEDMTATLCAGSFRSGRMKDVLRDMVVGDVNTFTLDLVDEDAIPLWIRSFSIVSGSSTFCSCLSPCPHCSCVSFASAMEALTCPPIHVMDFVNVAVAERSIRKRTIVSPRHHVLFVNKEFLHSVLVFGHAISRYMRNQLLLVAAHHTLQLVLDSESRNV